MHGRYLIITDGNFCLKIKKNPNVITIPNNRIVRNYYNFTVAYFPYYNSESKVKQKSDARFVAESSLRGVASYLMTIIGTHYILGEPDWLVSNVNKASYGAQLLYSLIKKENNGAEIRPAIPWNITSTDDITLFAFEGSTSQGGKKDI